MAETLASRGRRRLDSSGTAASVAWNGGFGGAGSWRWASCWVSERASVCLVSWVRLLPCAHTAGGGWVWWVRVGCGWLFVEMWIVDARASLFSAKVVVRMCRVVIFFDLGQVVKGGRWMPWHQEPMKDVGGRDRPGGAVNRAVIPGCPNGGTQLESCPVTCI